MPGQCDSAVCDGAGTGEREFAQAVERGIDAVLYDVKGTEIFVVERVCSVRVFLVQGRVLPLRHVGCLKKLADANGRVVPGLRLIA